MEQTISDQPSCLFKKSLKTSVTEKQLRNFLECSNLLHLNMIICLFELDFTNVFGVKLVFFLVFNQFLLRIFIEKFEMHAYKTSSQAFSGPYYLQYIYNMYQYIGMERNISMESIFKKRKIYEKNEDDSAQPFI